MLTRGLYPLLILITATLIGTHSARGDEAICLPTKTHTSEDEILELMPENLRDSIDGYKSIEAVTKYMGCWAKTDELQNAFVKKYKAKVLAASKATGVPFAILACLLFRESRWDKNAKSDSGALGIAQFLPTSWKGMIGRMQHPKPHFSNPYLPDNLLEGLSDKSPYLPKVKALVDYFKKNRDKDGISGREDLEAVEKMLIPLAKDPKFPNQHDAKKYLTNVRVALERLEAKRMYAKYRELNGGSPKGTLDENHIKDPDAAIIAGAIYLRTYIFRGVFGYETAPSGPDQWVIATGAYNIGPAALTCTPKMTANECIAKTYKHENARHETTNQMKSVRNCAEHGNGNPMANDTPRKCGV